jgi:uncharacterized protein YjiS (DUF1127 family)
MAYYSDRPYANAGSAAGIGGLFNTAVRSYASTGAAPQKRGLLAAAIAAVSTWNDRRLTRKSLMALTDRELEDIGLHRSEIEAIARR